VDVSEGPPGGVGDAPYYKGWDRVPARLNRTIDIVLAMFCPVALSFRSGHLTTFDSVSPEDEEFYGRETQEIVTRGFALVKPGGYMFFPRINIVDPKTIQAFQSTLPPGTHTAELIDIPKPRWIRHRQSDTHDVNEDYSNDSLIGLKVTKAVNGGRRRKTVRRRNRRKTHRRR
jgi:hypothetical protein